MALDLNLFIGLAIFLGFHELGHALLASLMGRYVTYVWHNGNPGVKHWTYKSKRQSTIDELQIITIAGFLFNIFTIELVKPMMADTVIEYLLLSIGVSLGDFYAYWKRIPGEMKEYFLA